MITLSYYIHISISCYVYTHTHTLRCYKIGFITEEASLFTVLAHHVTVWQSMNLQLVWAMNGGKLLNERHPSAGKYL